MDSLESLLAQLMNEPTAASAAFQLADITGQRAFAGLLTGLKNANPVVRNFSILGLTERKDSAAVPAITELLNDPEIYVRSSAAFALGKLCDSSCIPALGISLRNSIDVDAHLCRQLIVALTDICEESCTDLIKIGLQSPIVSVRLFTAETLGHIGGWETMQELSERLLHETDDEAKEAIKTALSELNRKFQR